MDNKKVFLTIRETAKTGILSEHSLRLLQKQGRIPFIMVGTKCLVNYPLLLETLNKESEANGKLC
ncbi:MAG: hypothetical protein IKB98_08760 [Clostridia bacterium]|nr:hypothetical protein [Clostridia bacterium]